MSGHCRVMLAELTEQFETDEMKARMRLTSHDPRSIFQALTHDLPDDLRVDAAAEFAVLPRSFLPTLRTLWEESDDYGLVFELISEAPPKPLEAARAGRVTYRIESDATAIRMVVQHVHGHHADWMTSTPELVAT